MSSVDAAYQHQLWGRPDPVLSLPISYVADRVRWGRLGRYLWHSRSIPGWVRGVEATRLAEAALGLPRDAVVVEVGAFLGCSTVVLAGARRLRGGRPLVTIDTFDASGDAFSVPIYRRLSDESCLPLRDRFQRNIDRAGLRDWVTVVPAQAERVFATWTEPIDFLFYDADHSYEAVCRLYDAWYPLLRIGGLIAIHNSQPHYRRDSHDGSSRLVEERFHPPAFDDIDRVDSLTFARKRA